MQALLETTVWKGNAANHTYLLDGADLVAYIKAGDTQPFYFKTPIKQFSKSKRTFVAVTPNPFKRVVKDTRVAVAGSKGAVYMVDRDAKTCTWPGFSFRGACKHTA